MSKCLKFIVSVSLLCYVTPVRSYHYDIPTKYQDNKWEDHWNYHYGPHHQRGPPPPPHDHHHHHEHAHYPPPLDHGYHYPAPGYDQYPDRYPSFDFGGHQSGFDSGSGSQGSGPYPVPRSTSAPTELTNNRGRNNQLPANRNQDPLANNYYPDENTFANVRPPRVTPPQPLAVTTERAATPNTLTILNCLRTCPTTSEFNPICGTNNVTYSNPGRLQCAKFCGIDVTMRREGSCAFPTAAPPTPPSIASTIGQTLSTIIQTIFTPTPRPATPAPTRFTTVDLNPNNNNGNNNNGAGSTISQALLDSIFTNPTTAHTPDSDEGGSEDIDIRTRGAKIDRTRMVFPDY